MDLEDIMNCHKVLDIPVESLIKTLDGVPRLSKDQMLQAVACDPKIFLHDHVYESLSRLGHLGGLVFEMRGNTSKDNIHIDYDRITFKPFWPCLNLILEGSGVLKWFQPETNGVMKTAGGNYYMAWHKDYGEPIDQWTSGKVALVRTDIPHNAFNYSNETRLSISVRWENRYTWEETLEWFDKEFKI